MLNTDLFLLYRSWYFFWSSSISNNSPQSRSYIWYICKESAPVVFIFIPSSNNSVINQWNIKLVLAFDLWSTLYIFFGVIFYECCCIESLKIYICPRCPKGVNVIFVMEYTCRMVIRAHSEQICLSLFYRSTLYLSSSKRGQTINSYTFVILLWEMLIAQTFMLYKMKCLMYSHIKELTSVPLVTWFWYTFSPKTAYNSKLCTILLFLLCNAVNCVY